MRKTLDKIQPLFFWPNMKRDVRAYVGSCEACQKRRRVTVNDRIPINPVERPDSAFQVLQIDLIGPISRKSSRGHSYVLCIVDQYSRWPEAYPLKTLKAKEVCDCLKTMFNRTGLPLTVCTDNATNMVSSLNEEMLKRLGVELRPVHPLSFIRKRFV